MISRTLGAGDPGFRFRALAGGGRGVTAGGMRAVVAHRTLSVSAPGGRLVLVASPHAPAAWYAAGPLGLEQGFEVTRPARSGRLTISLALGGTVVPRLAGGAVTFRSAGHTVFRYGALSASDRAGRTLRAWFTLTQRRLVIHVAAGGARYPIRIDPFVQAAELTAPTTSASAGAGFGDAVAVSGGTIAVGAPAATANGAAQGAVYVFSEAAGGWSAAPSVVELTEPATNTTIDRFGIAVALSGTTLVAGANNANGGKGAAWVFTEPAGGWTSGTIPAPAELTASDGASGNGFGFAVATDGTTVVAGSSRVISTVSQPVLYVFQEGGSSWSSQSGDTELTVANAPAGLEGHAIAVSSSVVAAGAFSADSDRGAVYVFQPPSGGWTAGAANTETATLTNPAGAPGDELGWSVALSGSTIAAGAPQPSTGPGAVDVWTEPAGGWSAPASAPAVLTATHGTAGDELGAAVGIETAVAPQTIVAAAPGAQSGTGVLQVFTEPAGGWSGSLSAGAQLAAGDGVAGDELGGEVTVFGKLVGSDAVAIDGATIVAGAARHASAAGAAYVFTNPTTTTTQVPALQTQPSATGSGRAGQRLTCAPGSWSGSPTGYNYQWNRSGTPIAGATGASYVVQTIDEQLSLTCTVTASNTAGTSAPATSNAIAVAVPKVRGCPGATGGLSGTTLGRLHLGMTRAQARRAFTQSSDRGTHYEDFFCLTPIGVRVGYGSPALLQTLPRGRRSAYAGRVVWASTSSAYYAIDGIRAGATIAAATARLHPGAPFPIGSNTWYVARAGAATAVLKVRHGIVEEIGIAQRALTATRTAQRALLGSFS